jgi:hypothetical protein
MIRTKLGIALLGLIAAFGFGWTAGPAGAQTVESYFQTDHSPCPGHCTLHVSTVPDTVAERDIESMTCSVTSTPGSVTNISGQVSITTPGSTPVLIYNLVGRILPDGPTYLANVNGTISNTIVPDGTSVPLVVPSGGAVTIVFNLVGQAPALGNIVCALKGHDILAPPPA